MPDSGQLRKTVLPAYLPDLESLPAPLLAHLTSATLTSLVIGNADGRAPSTSSTTWRRHCACWRSPALAHHRGR